MSDVVTYERRGSAAVVTMNRPEYRNAQNSAMTYALDEAFTRAVDDDEVKVIVLAGAGDHFSAGRHDSPGGVSDREVKGIVLAGAGDPFSAGHDIGSPGRDVDVSFERKA